MKMERESLTSLIKEINITSSEETIYGSKKVFTSPHLHFVIL